MNVHCKEMKVGLDNKRCMLGKWILNTTHLYIDCVINKIYSGPK